MEALISNEEYRYQYLMRSVDGGFPRPDAREEMRSWCNENTTGGFTMRWERGCARLLVGFREKDAALFFKLRYSNDVARECRLDDEE